MTFLLANWKLVAIGILLALLGLQQVRVSNAKADTAKVQQAFDYHLAQDAEAAQKAEQANREEENRREELKDQILDAAEKRVELAKADAARAAGAADSLRDKLNAYVAAVRKATSNPGAPAPSTATGDPIGVLAIMLERIDHRAGVIAKFADESRISGLACEAQYDGLRAAPQALNH